MVFRRETSRMTGGIMWLHPLTTLMLFACHIEVSRQLTGIANEAPVSLGYASTTGSMKSLPTLVFMGTVDASSEVPANYGFKDAIPDAFQYRILPASRAMDKDHSPWVSDDLVKAVVSPQTNCVDLLKATYITVKTGNPQVARDVPLKPVPASQDWVYNGIVTQKFRLNAEAGIMREYLSSCCDPAECPEKCLEFTASQTWYLVINAPQMGYDTSRDSRGGGSMYTLEYGDPGVWPVFRTQCKYCPVISCITSCSEGEVVLPFYATRGRVYY